MIQEKDRLDRAIDSVANRMISVPENDQMLETIVARLPERSKARWFAGFAPYALAGLAAVIFAIVSFDGRSDVRSPIVRSDPGTTVERPGTIVERPANDRRTTVRTVVRTIVERSSNDFDARFGLAPVEAPVAIGIESIAVESAIVIPAREMAPLVLSELPSLDDSRD